MQKMLKNPETTRKSKLVALDGFIVSFIFFISYSLRIVFVDNHSLWTIFDRMPWLVVPAVIIHLLTFYVLGLYELPRKLSRKILSIKVFVSVSFATISIVLLSFAFPKDQIGRMLTLFQFLLMNFGLITWRLYYNKSFVNNDLKILILGWNTLTEKIKKNLSKKETGFVLTGIVVPENKNIPEESGNPIPIFSNLEKALQETGANALVVVDKLRHLNIFKSQLLNLKFYGIEIYPGITFFQLAFNRVPVQDISDGWLLFSVSSNQLQSSSYLQVKRLIDFSFSLMFLLITSPLFLFIALLIKLDSKGPVFFAQERVGYNEKPFVVYKFRSMIDDAEKQCGPCWACADDPRITKVGKILRKTHLDEIPQFYNVLKGDMSLVGPRPFRKIFTDELAQKFPYYRLRFKTKPGLSGWAQVNMFKGNTLDGQFEKLEYEIYYLYNQSIMLDLLIIVKTVQSMIRLKSD